MRELSLFTGAGGGLLGTALLGWRPVGYVEWNDYCQRIIRQRIIDGALPNAPIFGDVRAFIGEGYAYAYQGMVDVITAGFPCQPFAAGGKHRGDEDPRNMWPETVRVIREVKPEWILLENSPRLLARHKDDPPYIQRIIGDLSECGYVGRWGVLSAASMGFPHRRDRLWIVANSGTVGWSRFLCGDIRGVIAPVQIKAREGKSSNTLESVCSYLSSYEERVGESALFRDDDGLAGRVDRLAAIGNGQVPQVAAKVWQMIDEAMF